GPLPRGGDRVSGRWRAQLDIDRSGLSAAEGGTTRGRRPMIRAGRLPVRAGGAFLVAVVMATLLSACGSGTYKVTATFDDVGDLQKSGGVQVADVRVGKIASISLTPDFRAKVSMAINRSVHIPKDSEA